MAKILFRAIVGSRGTEFYFPGSDLNLREIIVPDDPRQVSPQTQFDGAGTHSSWPLGSFIAKLLSSNLEALEMYYAQPRNVLKFDPVLVPLWRLRRSLPTHAMVDSLTSRANGIFKKAFDFNPNINVAKDRQYDSATLLRAFNLLKAVEFLLQGERFSIQANNLSMDFAYHIINHRHNREVLHIEWEQTIANVRRIQASQIRSPSQREINRGEFKEPHLPAYLSRESLNLFKESESKILEKLQAKDRRTSPTAEDWKAVLDGMDCRLSSYMDPISLNDFLKVLTFREQMASR